MTLIYTLRKPTSPSIYLQTFQKLLFKKVIFLITFLGLTFCSSAQAVFTTFGSGAWSGIGTWNIVSGTDADNIPDADDDVTILDGMTVTVSGGNQQVKNLTLQGTTGTRLIANGSTLSIFGTLTGPSTNFTNEVLQTNSTGLIKFEGGARALFGSWSVGSTTAAWLWKMEVALNDGAIGTAGAVRASYFLFSSGIYSCSEIRVDSTFADGSGVIVIGAAATVRFSTAIGTRLIYFTPSYCRSITVNGRLESTAQGYIGGQSVIINGAFVQKGYSAIISYPNGAGASEFVYGSQSSIEYAYTGDVTMGDEINRSPLINPTLDTIVINTGYQFGTFKLIVQNNDTIYVNNIRFGNYGKWEINSGAIIVSSNPKITNFSSDRFIATIGGDMTVKNVGATEVTFPVGPSLLEYNPVKIANPGTADNFTVKALSSRPSCLGPFPLTSIGYQWDIKEATAGGSNVTLSLGYTDVTKRGSGYVTTGSFVIHCIGSGFDYISGTGETGAGTFFTTGNNFSTFSTNTTFGVSSDLTILPLTFIKSFDAVVNNNDVAINWSVNCTSTSVTMDLENSKGNTSNFISIHKIKADAARCGQPFNYNDAGAGGDDNYYRIKLTDIDGSVSYSEIKHIKGKVGGFLVKISPNPVFNSSAQLMVNSDKQMNVRISISDAQGRIVQKKSIIINSGTNKISVDVSGLQKGIYFVKTFDDNKLLSIIKMVRE